MLADDIAFGIDDFARSFSTRDSRFALDDRCIAVLLRNEADFVGLFLPRDRQAGLCGDCSHLRFRQIAERKKRLSELFLRQLEQKIGLILRQVLCFAQLKTLFAACDACVMARCNFFCSDRLRFPMKEIELHVGIAEHARTRRRPAEVRLHER